MDFECRQYGKLFKIVQVQGVVIKRLAYEYPEIYSKVVNPEDEC